MTKKRMRNSKGRRRGQRQRRTRPLLRLFLLVVTTSLFALLLYVGYLDLLVQSQFEGKKWSLPARVYARPLELYVGMSQSATQLTDHLHRLGYRKSTAPGGPGAYRHSGQIVDLVTRSFVFWDGEEPSQHLRVEFNDGVVADLRRLADGSRPGLVRLDPVEIAGIYPAHREDRILVRRDQIPDLMVLSLLAVEDRKFYQHRGVDPMAIGRAFLANLRAGQTVQGGSTLTQQLVKNFFLTSERTLQRKLNEMFMALLVEWHYDKDEILEAYANEVYAGQDGDRAIHGFGLASQFYFGRPLAELAPEQIAMLVGILKGPSYYDPRRHPQRAKARRDLVLELMAEQHLLDTAAAQSASQRPLGVSRRTRGGITPHPAFLELVRRQLQRDYEDEDLTSEGLKVFTTLDIGIQNAVESAIAGGVPILESRHGLPVGSLQGAGVFSDAQTGEVLALVGSRNPKSVGFNRALEARRPIGSLVKPFVYLSALSRPRQYSLATLLRDEPLTVKAAGSSDWSPQNYDRRFHGKVPLRTALARSYNVATVNLGLELGVEQVVDDLIAYGLEHRPEPFPSLLLGTLELTPFEVATLYQVLASGGFRTSLRAIREVVAANGEPLRRYPLTVDPVAEPGPVFLTTRAMQDVVRWGTGHSLLEKVPPEWNMAAKTGTSNGLRDSWFAAFSADLMGVVWLGRDDNQTAKLSGSNGALRVFGDAVRVLDLSPLQPAAPANLEWHWVNPKTGLRTSRQCPGAEQLPFLPDSAPPLGLTCAEAPTIRAVHDGDNDKEADSWLQKWFR